MFGITQITGDFSELISDLFLSEKRLGVMSAARFTGNKLPIKIKHETHPESQRSEAQIKGKATSTPMMRRARPPKVVFSLEIKLFREETNELHICTHYSEAEL